MLNFLGITFEIKMIHFLGSTGDLERECEVDDDVCLAL